MTRRGAPALALILLALPGCALIDQRTFNPQAGMPPKPAVAPAVAAAPQPGPRPLLTVGAATDPASLRASVAKAVADARAIKRDVAFEVVEITPDATAGQQASDVAQLIIGQGVPPARVTLAARPVPDAPREVRVFVH